MGLCNIWTHDPPLIVCENKHGADIMALDHHFSGDGDSVITDNLSISDLTVDGSCPDVLQETNSNTDILSM